MKGLTLHRSSLTKEKMNILAGLSQSEKKPNTRAQLNQYYKTAKNQELDILWGGVQKSLQKVHGAAKSHQKSPIAYLTIGFLAGIIFMLCITFIVSVSTMATSKTVVPEQEKTASVALIGEDSQTQTTNEENLTQEKYVVKAGDTLTGIAFRFYGKYDMEKVQQIQKINNITNPEAISIGQELIIPVSQER